MIFSEVQRTLVKSPPELWAEISDPESLARHLGEFGEIRITRVHPEQKVEWEAGETSGTIAIKPSGWGTKVRLTVTREPAQLEPERAPEPELVTQPGLIPAPELIPEPDQAPDSEPPADPEHELAALPGNEAGDVHDSMPEPEPRRGFFARLFRRGRVSREELEPAPLELEAPREIAADEIAAETERPESVTARSDIETGDEQPADAIAAGPSPDADPPEDESADVSAKPAAAEEVAAEQVTAVLTGVLDRLGAAHHRPFSRA